MAIEDKIELEIEAQTVEVLNSITKSRREKAANKAAEKALFINRERTVKGWDINGKRFPPLSSSYKKWKRKVISGKVKLKETRTGYRAKSIPNHIRLTGRSLSYLKLKNISAKVSGNVVTLYFTIYQSNTKRAEIAGYLKDMKREYIGLVKNTSSKLYKQERDAVLKEFINNLVPKKYRKDLI